MSNKYNGWANWETWNVALWIGNDEGLYSLAKEQGSYAGFVQYLKDRFMGSTIAYQTPDGASWTDSGLDLDALEELVSEL